ncbi:RND family efflux transporter, MFP subunit [Burkholderiales bacterium JOSHI_001]|nr:RND family efflux transporter, MFP subunit [Burkholderiales bacterium JOSHI_001]
MNKLHTTVVALALAGAGGLAWWVQNRPQGAAVLAGAPAAAAAASGSASAPGGGGGSGPVAVEVARVQTLRMVDDTQAVGSLRASQSVVLRPEVAGRIAKLGFADGQRVKRGQMLVQLDDTLQRAQLQQADAQAGIARTNLQRTRDLVAQNFVSQSALDQTAANLEVAEAQVALARAQLARMKLMAPFDGVAGIRAVNVGDYVKDGADIVALEDLSSVWVDFRLPERYLSRLRVGQPVDLALDSLPGQELKASVQALDAQLDANGRSVLVRARLANPQGQHGPVLRGGMFARARVVFEVREQALVVPEEALVPMGDRQFLIKVVDGPQGGKVSQKVEARIGARVPGKVEVLQGLQAGDTVVLAGQARLMRGDGLPLKVVDLNRLAAPRSAASAPAAASAPRGGGAV